MLKRLVLISALLAPLGASAQALLDLFRMGTTVALMAGRDGAPSDPTPPTELTWDAPASSEDKAVADERSAARAITNLNVLIKSNPDSASLYLTRGQLQGRLGNGKKAFADLVAAQKLGSREPLLNLYLAQAALLTEQAAAAEAYLRQQRTLTPARPEPDVFEARLWLARPGILSQNCKQALLCLEKAVALDSTNLPARLLRGYAYFATNKYAPAIRDYQAILAQEPTNERVHFYLGQAYLSAENTAAACPHFRQGEAFAPTESRWYVKKYCR